MLTRGGFDIIKVLKNYSAKSERRERNKIIQEKLNLPFTKRFVYDIMILYL